MMGSPAGEAGRSSNEGPPRKVTIKRFAMGKTEVTQGQWKAIMGGNPSRFNDCGDDCPVENISWEDAQSYIKKLNTHSGKTYRLPSEAEWEYAARAGTITAYWWGNQASHEYANYGTDSCCAGLAQGRDKWVSTAPKAQFPANAFGLYDMHGNVFEWTQDCYANNYSVLPVDGTAYDTGSSCHQRVLRGGSWGIIPQNLRAAGRSRNTQSDRDDSSGFRLARTLPL
jgi:formylglycine-generating enzyme required for sulfatase activity